MKTPVRRAEGDVGVVDPVLGERIEMAEERVKKGFGKMAVAPLFPFVAPSLEVDTCPGPRALANCAVSASTVRVQERSHGPLGEPSAIRGSGRAFRPRSGG